MKDSHFASPQRSSQGQLCREVEVVQQSEVISGLLAMVGGLLAVLDENRQILAVNNAFLAMLGIDDPASVLGLRPGEALHCVHADEEEAGCGTARACASCGAAIAIVSSLGLDEPVERTCALRYLNHGRPEDMILSVRAQPVALGDDRFILMFLQDMTLQQKAAGLERAFFHDINNVLSSLTSAAHLLRDECELPLADAVCRATRRLSREMAFQQRLVGEPEAPFQFKREAVRVGRILADLESVLATHPSIGGRELLVQPCNEDLELNTDAALVERVLTNMALNALEASSPGERVRVWCVSEGDELVFGVWNPRFMPPEVSERIFQRHFTTKQGRGRGVGTYAMKLFGEEVLGGRVWFTTSPEDGTSFFLALRR